ncbi:hypothetical protein AB0J38_28390 [Streptomyces sp. NPDC050095]|uniref:hypothetical protein n=1 Tax=unclassified Streptomyces TaxID=2593676 RepID=UPI0034128869
MTFPGTGDIEADPTAQLRADVDPQVLVDQLWDACCHRLLLPDLPVTEEFTRSLVDNLMRGVRA